MIVVTFGPDERSMRVGAVMIEAWGLGLWGREVCANISVEEACGERWVLFTRPSRLRRVPEVLCRLQTLWYERELGVQMLAV